MTQSFLTWLKRVFRRGNENVSPTNRLIRCDLAALPDFTKDD